MAKKQKIVKLRKKRDEFWKDFCRMARRDSFSGIHIAGQLEKIQQELDKLEGSRRSKRYYPEINIEVF
jgi:hypothetical protein